MDSEIFLESGILDADNRAKDWGFIGRQIGLGGIAGAFCFFKGSVLSSTPEVFRSTPSRK